MTISVINDSWRRLTFADSITNWVNQGGASPAVNTDYYLSNAASIADSLARNQSRGWAYNIGAASGPIDLRDKVLSFWFLCNVAGFLLPIAQGGFCITLTANGSTYGVANAGNFQYYMGGNDTYTGGWKKLFLDPSKRYDTLGKTPTPAQLSAISHIGMFFRTGGTSIPGNLDNTFIDSIDVHNRKGINIVGTSSDIFEDLYTIDSVNGTGTTPGPIGIFTKKNGIYLSNTKLLFGSGTETTDVTGVGSTIVFLNPQFSGYGGTGEGGWVIETSPALDCGGVGYHISGSNTRVQFGNNNLVGGVTTLTAGLQYEVLFESTATGNFYGSRFDTIGVYDGTGTRRFSFSRGGDYDDGGFDWDGYIEIANSNYGFYTCEFNDCNQIVVNDAKFDKGFITDRIIRPPTTPFVPSSGNYGAVIIDTSFDMTEVNFINNTYGAIALHESGYYPFNLYFSNNDTDVYMAVENQTGIIQYQGGDVPTTGFILLNETLIIEFIVTLTITGFVDGSELFMRDATTETTPIVTRFNTELATGSYQYVYSDPGSSVDLFILKNKNNPSDTGYQWLSIKDYTLSSDNQTLQVQQILDRNAI